MPFNKYANRNLSDSDLQFDGGNRGVEQDVSFSSAEGMRSVKVDMDAPGVYEGLSQTAAAGVSGSGKGNTFLPKNG